MRTEKRTTASLIIGLKTMRTKILCAMRAFPAITHREINATKRESQITTPKIECQRKTLNAATRALLIVNDDKLGGYVH